MSYRERKMTDDEKPLVSIIMATHNRADLLLQRSIPSVLRQTYPNWELLIRGDGAGRDTEFVIKAFDDLRIKYKNLPRWLYNDPYEQWCVGGAHALNDALDDAKGTYIAHLDDDDELLPHYLETLLKLLRDGRYDIVYGCAYVETLQGWKIYGEPFDIEKLQKQNLMIHCTVMYDRAKLGHFRYDTEGKEPADWRMWKKMAAAGARFGFTKKIVAIHYAEEPYRRSALSKLKLSHRVINLAQKYGLLGLGKKIIQRNPVRLFKLAVKPYKLGTEPPIKSSRFDKQKFDKVKLHIGYGKNLFPSWINIDIMRDVDLRIDVRKGLLFEDNSVDFIYNEHFIEHLSADEAKSFFKECHRVLKPGGVLRIATPDLAYLIERYMVDWFDQTWVRDYNFKTACEMLNASFYKWGHKFLYDEETLRMYLEQSGFKDIRRCQLRQSRYPELCGLETRPESRLILEAVKG